MWEQMTPFELNDCCLDLGKNVWSIDCAVNTPDSLTACYAWQKEVQLTCCIRNRQDRIMTFITKVSIRYV